MTQIELKAALDDLSTKMQGKNAEEIKSAIDAFGEKFQKEYAEKMAKAITVDNEEYKAMKQDLIFLNELKGKFDVLQKHADSLDVKLQNAKNDNSPNVDQYKKAMVEALQEKFSEIQSVRKGAGVKMEVKAVGNMTAANNLTGSTVITYQSGVAAVPSQIINFADIVPSVQSSTGTYVIYRETGAEGSISNQTTPGNAKTQKDYDFTQVTFTANYLSGFVRFAKQMAQDLPFLQTFLPDALRRDYFKAENAQFYAGIIAAATASTASQTEAVERIIHDLGQLEAADYAPNGIILNPVDWATIAITKPSDFSLPSVVTFINGQLTINGVPVYKASWVTADEYVVGDWTMAKKVIVDGLAVEFFEQDSDNVQRNLITARVESRVVLAIDRPDAFILGTITATT